MVRLLGFMFCTLRSCCRTQRKLALENLVLRQQLAVVGRKNDIHIYYVVAGKFPDNSLLILKT